MKQDDIQIIGCKVAKKVSIDYYDTRDGYNYNVENSEYPHPDLVEAIGAFKNNLAESHYILGTDMDNFKPVGFQIHEAKGKFSVIILGKLTTLHGDKVTCSSGKIPVEEDGVDNLLKELRGELYAYFFNGKTAQGNLFEAGEKKIEEKEKKPETKKTGKK